MSDNVPLRKLTAAVRPLPLRRRLSDVSPGLMPPDERVLLDQLRAQDDCQLRRIGDGQGLGPDAATYGLATGILSL